MYKLIQHKNLTLEKWRGFEKFKQILMVGTEFERARTWLEKGDFREAKKCYERAYELLDLTIEDFRWRRGLKELLRFREIFGELYLNPNLELNKKLYKLLLRFESKAYNLLSRTDMLSRATSACF
jgi:tetratricopeptide (TPR) repeat protein